MPNLKNSSSLGRGLGSLIPKKNINSVSEKNTAEDLGLTDFSGDGSEPLAGDLIHISPKAIEPNPMQPRVHFSAETMDELVASIKEHGVLQPIVVCSLGGGKYQIIMGERRWRAAQRADLKEIPAIIRDADDRDKLELALIENIMREDLNPIELAVAYKRFMDEFAFTHEEASRRLKKSRSAISNSLRLLQLPSEIQNALRDGRLSDAHAKVIVGLSTPAQQLELFKQVVERGLSVARTRVETQKMGGTKQAHFKIDPRDEEMEKNLRVHLGTRASIQRVGYRGKIVIEFFNYDELVDIVEKILGKSS
ncbi:MAG: ParB/RepB/Spo0J family partition protein [bacterium]|nr:ParB/RepB/Spo0J family partition protein [bacterium]